MIVTNDSQMTAAPAKYIKTIFNSKYDKIQISGTPKQFEPEFFSFTQSNTSPCFNSSNSEIQKKNHQTCNVFPPIIQNLVISFFHYYFFGTGNFILLRFTMYWGGRGGEII